MNARRKPPVETALMILSILLAFACTLYLVRYLSIRDRLMTVFLPLLIWLGAMVLQVLLAPLHESGHALAGLMAGYRLYYLTLGRQHFVRTPEGGWRRGVLRTPGVLGSCCMYTEEEPPRYCLYLLGGALMDLLCCLLAFGGCILLRQYPMAHVILLLVSLAEFLNVLGNLLPRQLSGGMNDGAMLRALRKNPVAREANSRLMKLTALMAKEVPPARWPAELLCIYPVEQLDNPFTQVTTINTLSSMLSTDREKGYAAMVDLMDCGAPFSPRNALLIRQTGALHELLYAEPGKMTEALQAEMDSPLARLYRDDLDAIVARYALARLMDNDQDAADDVRRHWREVTQFHPFPWKVKAGERLLDAIDRKAEGASAADTKGE